MSKKIIAVAIVLVVIIFGVISFYYLKIKTPDFLVEPDYQEPPQPPPPPPEVINLEVRLLNTIEEWKRGENSLPVCETEIEYVVYNHGNKDSPETNITITVDEETLLQKIVSIPSESYVKESVFLTTKHTESHFIEILASAEDSKRVKTHLVNPVLPRKSLSEEMMKLYVTPFDPWIKNRVDNILENKPFWDVRADWSVILDWVKNNIKYEGDYVLHNEIDYWQLPQETLFTGKGDCEDQALLLCSMLRAKGYQTDEVYVIVGIGEESAHAWVTLKVTTLFGDSWIYLEPTSSGWFSDVLDFFYQITGEYESKYGNKRVVFNDYIFYGN